MILSPQLELKYYNVTIDRKIFYDESDKSTMRACDKISNSLQYLQRVATVQGND